MIAKPYLSVVIPAYNESRRIAKTLRAIHSYLERQTYSWEVIVVDDGSNDETVKVTEQLGLSNVRVLKQPQNLGKGMAVKRGMLTSEGEYRIFCDADNATPFAQIERFWPLIEEYQALIGSRYIPGSRIVIEQTFVRRFLSRAGNLLIQLLLLPGLKDTQCGFKLFSARAAEDIFSRQTIERWGFDMEILYLARKKGYRVKEVPVDWYDRTGSKVHSSRAFIKTLMELFKIRWNGIVGIYNA